MSEKRDWQKKFVGRELGLGIKSPSEIAKAADVGEDTLIKWSESDELVMSIRDGVCRDVEEKASRAQLRIQMDADIYMTRLGEIARDPEDKNHFDGLKLIINRLWPEKSKVDNAVQINIDTHTQKQINDSLSILTKNQHSGAMADIDLDSDPHFKKAEDVEYGSAGEAAARGKEAATECAREAEFLEEALKDIKVEEDE